MSGFDGVSATRFYNSAGLFAGAKIWVGTVTSSAGGAFTVDYSAAGFSASPVVFVTARANTTVANDCVTATLKNNVTATGCGGNTTKGTTAILNASTNIFAGNVPVDIVAIGV